KRARARAARATRAANAQARALNFRRKRTAELLRSFQAAPPGGQTPAPEALPAFPRPGRPVARPDRRAPREGARGVRGQAQEPATNPFPVAFCCPCESNHCPRPPDLKGRAADCIISGMPIQDVVDAATIRRHGLEPLAGDEVHVEG
ncbi:MAG: hypothetical protein ACRDSN_20765, partial [Pseudonocardiaceae bacterium]